MVGSSPTLEFYLFAPLLGPRYLPPDSIWYSDPGSQVIANVVVEQAPRRYGPLRSG